MISYPGQMFGLYDPPDIEKEQCQDGIPCVFGICSECTQGVSQEVLEVAFKTDHTVTIMEKGNK